MRQKGDGIKLPQKLLVELDIDGSPSSIRRHNSRQSRKDQRKAERVQKKRRPQQNGRIKKARKEIHDIEPRQSQHAAVLPRPLPSKEPRKAARREVNHQTDDAIASSKDAATSTEKASKGRFAKEDAEIEALEKALGLGGKRTSKSFGIDGLDEILGDIHPPDEEVHTNKRVRDEESEWLQNKRRKAIAPSSLAKISNLGRKNLASKRVVERAGEDERAICEDISSDGNSSGFEDDTPKPPRENPYKPPQTASKSETKYVAPSLRSSDTTGNEELRRLRRRIQGLLNRMSEANFLSIVSEVEVLYRENPRQHVSSSIIELIMALTADPSDLSDTFMVLHGGFLAALYKILGADFGAQVLQRAVEDFDAQYHNSGTTGNKKVANLMSLLSELYNYQVIGSNTMYDFIRMFTSDISETNTELLLRMIKHSGPQLRADNPSSLKEIVLHLHSAVDSAGGLEQLSVRTRYMMDTINDLKNNRMRTGLIHANILSEHVVKLKRLLGTLNSRSLKATEPLQISVADIRNSDKRGKWWLVGASHKGKSEPDETGMLQSRQEINDETMEPLADLLQLAKQQRMNTDVRRSIFVTIMSATDYKDAHMRLIKLRLKRNQEQEIAKVINHCVMREAKYNRYYTLVAGQFCVHRKYQVAFQFSLWDIFKRIEGDEEDDRNDDSENDIGLRAMVNLARMYGSLVANGDLGLSVLKKLDFAYLQPKTSHFVEVMLITLITELRRINGNSEPEQTMSGIFLSLHEMPTLIQGLRYFEKKVLRRTDLAGTKQDKVLIGRGCKVIEDVLKALSSGMVGSAAEQ